MIEDLEQNVIHLKQQIQVAENRRQKQLRVSCSHFLHSSILTVTISLFLENVHTAVCPRHWWDSQLEMQEQTSGCPYFAESQYADFNSIESLHHITAHLQNVKSSNQIFVPTLNENE